MTKGAAVAVAAFLVRAVILAVLLLGTYRMGENAGRAKELANSIVNAVAQEKYEEGYWDGLYKGVDRATVKKANKL